MRAVERNDGTTAAIRFLVVIEDETFAARKGSKSWVQGHLTSKVSSWSPKNLWEEEHSSLFTIIAPLHVETAAYNSCRRALLVVQANVAIILENPRHNAGQRSRFRYFFARKNRAQLCAPFEPQRIVVAIERRKNIATSIGAKDIRCSATHAARTYRSACVQRSYIPSICDSHNMPLLIGYVGIVAVAAAFCMWHVSNHNAT